MKNTSWWWNLQNQNLRKKDVTSKLDKRADCRAMPVKHLRHLLLRSRLGASKSKLVAFFGLKILHRGLIYEHKGQCMSIRAKNNWGLNLRTKCPGYTGWRPMFETTLNQADAWCLEGDWHPWRMMISWLDSFLTGCLSGRHQIQMNTWFHLPCMLLGRSLAQLLAEDCC